MQTKSLKNIYTYISFLVVVFLVAQSFFIQPQKAEAATFSIQVGSYVGDGTDDRAITGLGFQPDLVLLKDNTNVGAEGILFKTSTMTGEQTLALAETDNATSTATNHIQSLDSDGFTVGTDADVNTANLMYYYIAIGGSDCTASGTFCVGSYTGTGTLQTISSVGFDPDFVAVRSMTTQQGMWKSDTVTGLVSNYFSTTAQNANQGIRALTTGGFTVGTRVEVNTNATVYHYFAFKKVAGAFDTGSYTGNGTDNRNITTTSFEPDAVFVKSASTVAMIGNIRENYGDRSFSVLDANSDINHVQQLLGTGGFQVGNSTAVNTNATLYHYFAFGGAGIHNDDASGTYTMAQGTYTGTGSAFTLTDVPFAPDLVMIKGNTAQYAVFRTRLMAGNRTSYMAAATNIFTNGILSLNNDGFSLGTGATVNGSGITYTWTAFGNASRIDKAGGATDFMIGQYIGTSNDNQNVRDLNIDPDFVFIKRAGNSAGVWRTSQQTGDQTLFLSATAQSTNRIQNTFSGGFQKGTSGEVNTSNNTYDYFIFSDSGRFDVGQYTGTGSAQDITSLPASPDLIWTKKITGGTARAGISRSSEATGDFALSFLNLAGFTGRITNLILNGFSLGTQVESNESAFDYQYVAWNNKFYTQQGYRFFENDDSTNVGTALAAQDTLAIVPASTDPFRLRLLVRTDKGNLFQDSEEFKLQFAEKSGTCDTSFSGESYSDVATSGTDIAYYNNSTPAHNAALTTNGNDPTDGLRVIANQSYNEQNPITNSVGSVLKNQTAKFDFALVADTAPPATSYCLRLVYSDGSLLDTYTSIPEIISASIPQEISFSISDNSIGFGTLSSTQTRYATGNNLGSITPITAHNISASTNGLGGYSIVLDGTSLACNSCVGVPVINSIGIVATAPAPMTEQFGLRSSVVTGTGTVSTPYNTSNYAFDDGSPDEIATGIGDNTVTTYDMEYIANINPLTPAGEYTATLTYTMYAIF